MSTKLVSAYVRLTCRPYLAEVLGPVISPIVHKNSNLDVRLRFLLSLVFAVGALLPLRPRLTAAL
jgi:hypothetical protein